MKIAMIGQKRVPSREGGIEVVVTELATRMVERGHEVICYNRWEPSVQKDMKKVDEYRGIRLLRVRTFRRSSLNAIVYALSASLKALRNHFDVIHLHAEGPASMSLILHWFRVPTVVTIHGLDWQRAKWGGFATRFLRFGEKMAARYADQIIVLSEGTRQYFWDSYQRETLFIPNGVRIKPFRQADEIARRWGLQKGGYILFLARLVPEKGLHYLIEAFRGLQTDQQLVIAGKIDLENEYIASVCEKAKSDPRILMTDFVTGDALSELMCNASVYVLPSDIEGMPMSVLEALSYGQRCLLSDIPENKETAGTFAHYFKHGDVESLKEMLSQILAEPDKSEDTERRIEYVRNHYDWDQIAVRTLETYRAAIKAHPNSASRSSSI